MVGNLDRRIQLGTFTTAKNLSGEDVRTWTYADSIWAEVKPVSGSEGFEADQKVGEQLTEFTIRFRTGVAQTGQILYNSDTYTIESVLELNRKKYLKIIAKKQDNE